MLQCPTCEEYTLYSLCSDCRKIRHYMSIYSKDRVIEILDSILSRTQDKQDNKVKSEIKKDIKCKLDCIGVHKTERDKLDEEIKKEIREKFKDKKY